MPGRAFVVTVSQSPARVVVEDVRSRRRAVAADLAAVGGKIASLLETSPSKAESPRATRREAERGPAVARRMLS